MTIKDLKCEINAIKVKAHKKGYKNGMKIGKEVDIMMIRVL